MTAGDAGVQIVVNAGGYNLTGSTCRLFIAPGYSDSATAAVPVSPMTVSSDGSTATYTTTGTDFTVGGEWSLQLEVRNGQAKPYTSAAGTIFVYPHL